MCCSSHKIRFFVYISVYVHIWLVILCKSYMFLKVSLYVKTKGCSSFALCSEHQLHHFQKWSVIVECNMIEKVLVIVNKDVDWIHTSSLTFIPWIWNYYIVSEHQEPVTQCHRYIGCVVLLRFTRVTSFGVLTRI